MIRQPVRIRIDDEGQLEIVDPCLDELPLLREIDPDFEVQQSPLPGFGTPRFLRARRIGCRLSWRELTGAGEPMLWELHTSAMRRMQAGSAADVLPDVEEATVLDLKIELARRILMACRLCAHRCGVDRTKGERGICQLGMIATVAEHFVHIAEESPINPSLVLNLAGCGLRCRFCQQSALLDPRRVEGQPLDRALWRTLDVSEARSLSFVGGNPDESLYAVLQFLNGAPAGWRLPIVWNCHGAATLDTVTLLDGLVDAYVPDFKYGDEACGRRLSGIADYPSAAGAAISEMLAQGVPVIVRILVLPGHLDCCHLPALDVLASMSCKERLLVSVRGQYCPDWQVTKQDGALARRPTAKETDTVRGYAIKRGLSLID